MINGKTDRLPHHLELILKYLHWPPVDQDIGSKILLFSYKVLNDLAPSYLDYLLAVYTPVGVILDQGNKLYSLLPSRPRFIVTRRFPPVYPNSGIPRHAAEVGNWPHIDIFKSNLKTFLFRRSFC